MTSPLCRLSVIIPTYQRCASVQRALQALSRQTLLPDQYEVVVSIDGSQDGTGEMVSQFSAPYTLRSIWQPNLGRAAARNAGMRLAAGDLLIFLDDDMEPAPGFLAAHLQAHASGFQLCILGAVPISLEQSSPAVVKYIGWKFNQHLENLSQPGYTFKLRDFYSGNFSIRREVLVRIGAFDEAFKIYGNEDLELFVRLSKASVELKYCPEALARQYYTKDFAALARDNIAKGRTAVLLASKYPETYDDLKLSMYSQASLKWRFVRAGLLQFSRVWTRIPELVILFMTWVERHRPARFDYCCFLALDYFYWLGARSALRGNSEAGQGLTSLATSAGKPRS